jgi:hypothetical protein
MELKSVSHPSDLHMEIKPPALTEWNGEPQNWSGHLEEQTIFVLTRNCTLAYVMQSNITSHYTV